MPVAVTYEPYLTVAMAQNKDVKLLFTAGEDPGLISDVLVVRDDVIKSRPGQVLALIKSWDAALKAYNADTPEGRAIIAKAVGSSRRGPEHRLRRRDLLLAGREQDGAHRRFHHQDLRRRRSRRQEGQLLTQDVTPEQMIDAVLRQGRAVTEGRIAGGDTRCPG